MSRSPFLPTSRRCPLFDTDDSKPPAAVAAGVDAARQVEDQRRAEREKQRRAAALAAARDHADDPVWVAAARAMGRPMRELVTVRSTKAGVIVETTGGPPSIIVPPDRPDGEGKTGVMLLEWTRRDRPPPGPVFVTPDENRESRRLRSRQKLAAAKAARRAAEPLPVPPAPPPPREVERYLRSWAPVDERCAELVARWDEAAAVVASTDGVPQSAARKELAVLEWEGRKAIAAYSARVGQPAAAEAEAVKVAEVYERRAALVAWLAVDPDDINCAQLRSQIERRHGLDVGGHEPAARYQLAWVDGFLAKRGLPLDPTFDGEL